MKKVSALLALLIFSIVFSYSAQAWDGTGHKVVAQIAWNNLDNATKRRIIDALKNAPPELLARRNDNGTRNSVRIVIDALSETISEWPSDVNDSRYEEQFQFIATWPDIVRNTQGVQQELHKRDWHYRDIFWNARDRSNSSLPGEGELVNKLSEFTRPGSNENLAVQVAWIFHLVGDIHQPLHCSGRVTNDRNGRDGDKGGNEFCLGSPCSKRNLHSYWDGSLTRAFRHQGFADFQRIARDISNQHRESEFSSLLNNLSFDEWTNEGVEKAKQHAYPNNLRSGVLPSGDYEANTLRVSESSIALAGYRLARVLRNRFGT